MIRQQARLQLMNVNSSILARAGRQGDVKRLLEQAYGRKQVAKDESMMQKAKNSVTNFFKALGV